MEAPGVDDPMLFDSTMRSEAFDAAQVQVQELGLMVPL